MKKLVAAFCFVYFGHSLPKVSPASGQGSCEQRVLVKAIADIVNTESAKKMPPKPTFVASSESPLF